MDKTLNKTKVLMLSKKKEKKIKPMNNEKNVVFSKTKENCKNTGKL